MQVDVVVRVFQARATHDTYDKNKAVAPLKAIQQVLRSPDVRKVLVVTNTEAGNPLAEVVDETGISPTKTFIGNALRSEGDRVNILQCATWGKNPGSATAINLGCRKAVEDGAMAVMVWSPELAITTEHIATARRFLISYELECIGFLRQGWFHRLQHHVLQNTGAIYMSNVLEENGFFDPSCNGDGRTIQVRGFEKGVPLAGMEDFHFLLRRLKRKGVVRWGMVCRTHALPWDTNFEPGSDRALLHAQKLARQEAVMYRYIEDIFGVTDRRSQDGILEQLFLGMQMD